MIATCRPSSALEFVFREQPIEHLLCREALSQQLEPARTIAAIHRRLRGHRADARLRPRHVVADAEHPRRNGDAEIAGHGIERNNGKRRGRGSGGEQDDNKRCNDLHDGSFDCRTTRIVTDNCPT